MPALFTNQDAAIVELRTKLAEREAKLARVTVERDRARDTAVALEQDLAAERERIAQEIEADRVANRAEGYHTGFDIGMKRAAHIARGGAA